MGAHWILLLCALITTFPDVRCTSSAGTDFITAYIQNGVSSGSNQRCELRITGLHDQTNVNVQVGGGVYNSTLKVDSRRTVTVRLPIASEMRGSGNSQRTVRIIADKDVAVLLFHGKASTGETTEVIPINNLGKNYYVYTPANGPSGSSKVVAVVATGEETSVEILAKGSLQYNGIRHAANSVVRVTLVPWEAVQFLSIDDLSGSQVIANKNVAVISGHTCAQKNVKCNCVFEQLKSVDQWGNSYVVPPFSLQDRSDVVVVIAAESTHVTVSSGDTQNKVNMVAGQVLELEIINVPLRIEADHGVQAMYFAGGGKFRRGDYGPFIMNTIDTDSFCSAYAVFGQQGTENFAIIIAENAALNKITFDGNSFRSPNWNPIAGTDLSWLEYSYGTSMTSHRIENPDARFGVQSLGISAPFSYGSPGSCVKDPGPPPPSCRNIHCPSRQVCIIENKKPKCVKPQVDLCWASGDPHFRTSDGLSYDFMGTCTYKFADVCGDVDPDLPKFTVLAKNDNRGSVHVSYVAQVTLQTGEHNIVIKKGEYGYVRVDNCLRKLPIRLSNGTLRIFQSGISAIIQLGNNMMMSYDWNHVLWLELTRQYAGKMCGMCGNYNQDPNDDYLMPSGTKAGNVVDFGASWAVPDNTLCWHDCHGSCRSCPPNVAQTYTTDDFCGLIGKSNGPFSACHSALDPKLYMDNCVFDVCINNGYKKLSCEAVGAYADACQRSGVNIGLWRDIAGCPLPCPENSSYKSCSRACPATCEDPEAKSTCDESCVETCECNTGFVLSENKCISRKSCGCSYNGFSYAPNEEFWNDQECRQKCKCNPETLKVECQNSPCRAGEECAVRDGILNCYPKSYGTCVASCGYITFDKKKVDFQGTCMYLLAGLSDRSRGLPDLQVRIRRQSRGNADISYTTAVHVNVDGVEIQVSRRNPKKVVVNNQLLNLPYRSQDGSFSLYLCGHSVILKFQFGATLSYDYNNVVILKVPDTYSNALYGICGNFNNNPNDDLIPKGGNAVVDPVTFGKSWKVEETFRCQDDGSPVCYDLASEEKRQRDSATLCGVLVSQQGPFRECHSAVDPQVYFADCVLEYCVLQKQQRTFCSVMTAYMMACQGEGVTVHPWRQQDLCPFSCPAHSSYEVCSDPCIVTCNGLSVPDGCSGHCTEDCVCNDGFIRSGGECIPISDCGCSYNGAYYTVDESIYVGDTCSQTCSCTLGGIMKCVSSSCSSSEECRVENGVLGCHPLGSATCVTSGYSNYQTFDGLSYKFQGQCSFVLAQTYSDDASGSSKPLDAFNVTLKRHGPGEVESMTMEVGGQTLTLRQHQQGLVQINGANTRVPVTLNNGKIRVECFGQGILIKTNSGLHAIFDLKSHVSITVPGNYRNAVRGLCGNYDGKADDDGVTSGDVTEFANRWKAPEDAGKECDACGSQDKPCRICMDQKLQVFSSKTYCGILNDPSGPFAKCHSVVNPASFHEHCVFDLCETNGEDSYVLCDSAYAYAEECRRAGVKDLSWRTDTFCPMTCDPHSHYRFCADMCSTTCAAFADLYECSENCGEGCECDKGYVFDGANCVSLDQCGCFDNGRYYKANEIVLNDDCSQECSCNPISGVTCLNKTCAQDEKCQILDGVRACVNDDPCKSKTCRSKETCQLKDGLPVCVPDFKGTCMVYGDPHYCTLDGWCTDAQGTCSYIISQYTGNDTGLVPFQIIHKNDNRGSQDFSFVKKVELTIYNTNIAVEVGQFPSVKVNGERTNLPAILAGGKIKMYRQGFDCIIEMANGMTTSFDWNGYFTLTLCSSYFGEVSGLCGNFDQDPDNDQRTQSGTLVTSIPDWLQEWKVYDRDPFCFHECPNKCPTCEESKKVEYGSDNKCGIIFKHDGPFRECVKKIKPERFFDACLFDVCLNNGAQVILCQSLEILASTCLNEGLKLYDWRTSANCPKLCGDLNSHYNACGIACPASCSDRTASSRCTRPCVETCECNANMLLSGGKCVPVSECGCQYNGRYYEANQSWYDEKCVHLCKCDSILGMVICEETSCKKSETCKVADGVRGCYPTQYTTCEVSGDLHYTTFDKSRFIFKGTCSYQLVSVTTDDPSLPKFTISVHNSHKGNKAMAFINDVTLVVYGKTITLYKVFPQRIKVDGQFPNLPYYFNSTKIIVYTSGCKLVLTTENNLKITLDRWGNLQVTLPGTYAGAVSGLCANNNGKASDDFDIGNGITAKSEQEFGDHWKVGEVVGCTSECTNCPKCKEEDKETYKSDQYCGLITKADGPFSQCHAAIDPTPFFEDCVSDACAYKGHQSAVCKDISSYVSECQKNGSMVKEWRASSFCDLTCPPKSHYGLLENGCPATCFGLIAPPSCEPSYTEGCYCDNGFILSGEDCVPISECGCVFEDAYYKLGQEFYTDDRCKRKCTCGANGITSCKISSCGGNEECKVIDGVLGCNPKEFGECVALPGPYYISTDGLFYELQGTCTYTFIRVKKDPVNFEVALKLDDQTATRSVTVRIGENVIDLQKGSTWTVLINKEKYNIPCQTQRKEFWINKEGNNVLVQTRYGCKVRFDGNQVVTVWIPSSFAGATKGLCGNFNKNPNDDFRLPNGSVVSDVTIFGKSWATGSDCHGCSGDQCPKCDQEKAEQALSPFKCGLIADPEGPFKGCHALVPPETYVKSCTSNVCLESNGPDALCVSLQAYASLCQDKGGKIEAWRSVANCPLSCSAKSHYELCTRTCDLTCNGLWATSTCSKNCFEGCECDAGYMFDGEQCVTMENCGCSYNGRYFRSGETLFSEDCGQECTCSPTLGVRCQNRSCAEDEICQVRDGVRSCSKKDPCVYKTCREMESCKAEDDKAVCVPDYTGECWVMGDLHHRTFDGKIYDVQGTCTYILSQYSGSDTELEPFRILIKNANRGPQAGSYVKKVELSMYGYNVSMEAGGSNKIWVNGEKTNLPVSLAGGKLIVSQNGFTITAKAQNDLMLRYDRNSVVTVNLPSSYYNMVNGFCGSFNQDPSDDQPAPIGDHGSSIASWIEQWKVHDGDLFCSDQCKGPCPTCDENMKLQYRGKDSCGIISSEDGPFRDCIKSLIPNPFFDACLFDVCVSRGAKIILCKAIETYARACLKEGVKVYDWRKDSDCPMVCDTENSHFNACGNACPATCSDRNAPTRCSKAACVETCECNEGTFLSGDKCVPVSGCGCEHNGRYYELSQPWYDEKCSTLCKCDAGKAVCQPSKCKDSETCKLVNGVRGCHPTGYSICTADGDPHYITFDGKRYSFMGSCIYQLVNVTSTDPSLVPFSITVENDQRGNRAVSMTKGVTLQIYDKTITLSRDHPHEIKVDDQVINLPFHHEKTKVTAYFSGNHIILQRGSDVYIRYDGQNYLLVKVSNTYKGALGGLCGSNNNNPSDDFLKRDGIMAKNPKEFGDHWKVGEFTGCKDECTDCLKCSDKEREVYRDNKYCGLLIQADGPFGQCHASINPNPFFENCLYDACAYKGHQSVVCASLSSYVYECQSNGSTIKDWRTSAFCEMTCSPDSHYELLGNGCPTTCLNLIAPPACEPSYTEGCYCNDGFILSGENCMPISECGCAFQDNYYKMGQEFYTDNRCQKKCTCGKNGVVKCDVSSCGANEECKVVDGTLGCHPKEFAQCKALGDRHIITADGKYYDFHGTCSYVLLKIKKSPIDFEVIVDNEASGNMVAIKSVAVQYGPYNIYLGREGSWSAMINKEKYNLPCQSQELDFWINQEGNNIFVNTKDQIVVLFNQKDLVSVSIPSTFFGITQGLCGDSNKNPNDDFRLPNGTVVTDQTVFGDSWMIHRDGSNCQGCSGDQCPECNEASSALAKSSSKCGMIADPHGPFKDCHELVKPDDYVKSCVFDICNGRGGQEAFCGNLQSYTALCQAKGARIGEWRNLTSCPLTCPVNSHYNLCTKSCDFTCYGLLAAITCSERCYEGCEPDSGYVFDGDHCVAMDQCGCLYNGRYLKARELLVNDDCSQECTCDPSRGVICSKKTCTEDEKCQLLDGVRSCVSTNPCSFKNCREKETCQVQDNKAVCVPNYSSICWAFGDPHFKMFDGNEFDHQGTCTYILSKYDGSDPSLEPFEVTAKSNNRGSQATSFVMRITVNIYGLSISWQVGEFPTIRINGVKTNLPVILLDGKLSVTRSGLFGVLEAANGLEARFDWNFHGIIKVSSSYYNSLFGMCGDLNGDPHDDQRAPNGTIINSTSEWVKTLTVYDRDPFCFHTCPSQCPYCDEKKKQKYGSENTCGMIYKEDGPFRECIKKVDPRQFFDACLHDVCLNDGAKSILCPSLDAYASTCRSQDLKIYDWRTPSDCPMVCEDKNSHYNACANACPASCFNRNAEATCAKSCIETCECNKGMVLSGDKCVPVSSCGCQYNGQYYQPNQSWYDDKCSVLCKCDSIMGLVNCQPTSCKDNEQCVIANGKRGCYPTEYSTCVFSGDHHYLSFDNNRFRFMGSCVYQLVKATSNDTSLTPFTINIFNDHRGNQAMFFTKKVTLEVYNKVITMSKDYPQQIQVDGVFVDLPYDFEYKKVSAFQSGSRIIVKVANDVTLAHDGWNLVQVTLANTYKGAIHGLCGDYNGNPSDDFAIGDGVIAKTADEFGEHWKVGEVKGCKNGCSDCPKCTEKDQEVYKSDRYCGLLTKSDGPFKQCQGAINPTPYLENCVFDACAYKGHQSVVCASLKAYVSDCQRNGSVIKDWRTSSFCEMTCPSNSHYELIGNSCPATCVGLIPPPACEQSYHEGCYCNNGFILSGKDCVSLPQCGCVFENVYHKAEQEFYTDNQCQRKCSCGHNGAVSCQTSSCGADEECKAVNGLLGCHPKELGQCITWGTSHFLTLDGKYFDFHGTCSYTLIKVARDQDHFEVTITNKPYANVAAKQVTVRIGQTVLYLNREKSWSILLNKEKCNLPYRSQKRDFWINKEGNNEILNTKYGFTVFVDSHYLISVKMPSSFSGLTEGLCGNYDKNPDDDFRLPNKSLVTDSAVFGKSWAVARDGSNCQGCSGNECPKCDDARSTAAKSTTQCGMIGDPQGPFKECHELVGPKQYVDSCVLDVCAARGGQAALCASLQAYTALCQERGAKIEAWRNISKCALTCPTNSHFESCTRTCDFTCNGLLAPSTCDEKCFEGCQCNTGYMFDGENCVTMDKCGCVYNGRYLKGNEVLVSEDCSQRCTCQFGAVSCTSTTCATNEICQLRNGVRNCQPKNSECTLRSDLHFTTFDGASGNFPELGSFILASSCNASADQQFMVVIDVHNCGGRIGRASSLQVFTPLGFISVNQDGQAWLNGWELKASTVLGGGAIAIQISRSNVTIGLYDKMTVNYGVNYGVKLIAKEKIAGNVCGSCGNFNGDSSDDLLLKQGDPSVGIWYTIYSWAAKHLYKCIH